MGVITVGVEGVNDFHNDACAEPNRTYNIYRPAVFAQTMQNYGLPVLFQWFDDNAWETDFRDPSFGNGGDSHNWSDNVNFYYYADHGGNNNTNMSIAFSFSHNQCQGNSSTWRFGSTNLKWLVFDCCNFVSGTNNNQLASWFQSANGVHILMGFIGESVDTDGYAADFASDILNGSTVAGAWVNDAYSWWDNDFPIAIAFGADGNESQSRLNNETLEYLFFDQISVGSLSAKWQVNWEI